MNPVPLSLEKGRGEKMKIVEVDASGLSHKGLNDKLRDHMLAGVDKIVIRNVYGQRYIGTRLYSPGSDKKLEIEVFGQWRKIFRVEPRTIGSRKETFS